jgi:hypothetical protein
MVWGGGVEVDVVRSHDLWYYRLAVVNGLAKGFLIFVGGVLVRYFNFVIGDEVQYFSAVVSLVDNNN